MPVSGELASDGDAGNAVRARIAVLLVVLAVAAGIWLRLLALDREGFWLDEVYSAAFANLSAAGTLFAVLLLDVHPPLYYLQLNAWGIFGHSDFWLRMNSVFWSTGTLLAVFFGTRRQSGYRAGLLALLFCDVMGSEIYFAHELRMYPMASCLAVLSWIAANRMAADYRFRNALPLIVILALLGAIHSASVLAASAALLYVLPGGDRRQIRARLGTWVGVAAVVVCSYLPWIINAGSRNVIAHAAQPSLPALNQTVGGWLIGYGQAALPWWLGVGASCVVVLGLVAALLACRRLSRLVVCFLAWPLLFGALLCVTVQPIWLDRTFAFCAPFVAIAFGTALGHWLDQRRSMASNGLRYAALGSVAVLLLGVGGVAYLQVITPSKPDQYRELAAYLASQATDGEMIYVPRDVDFWGLSRYLVGPDWGSMLRFEDQPKLDGLRRWRRAYAWLGPARLEQQGFMPDSRRLDGFSIPVYTGESPLPALPSSTGGWLVSIEDVPLPTPAESHLCIGEYPAPIKFGRVDLYHWGCPGG